MKKLFILIPVLGLFAGIVLSSYHNGPGSAASLERTGASGGTAGCGTSGCHNPTASASVPVTMTLASGTTPVTSYTPGASYNVVITCTYTTTSSTILSKCGFQVAVMKGTSTSLNAGIWGTLPASTHTVTVSGINLVEQSTALPPYLGTGGTGTIYGISIPWTAPAAGTGDVKLYGALNAVNFDGNATSADLWNTATATIPEATSTTVGTITGSLNVCAGATTALSCTPTGGTWSSSTPAIATVSAAGVVTGVLPGTSTITYNAGASGTATAIVSVAAAPAAITGTASACIGATTTLSSSPVGSTWSSGTATVATITAAGVVTGVTAGTSVISYTNTAGCRSTIIVTINAVGAAPIGGTSTVCVGTTLALTDLTPAGTWTSSTPAKATVGAATGIVTGVAIGTTTISYAATNTCGTSTKTHTVNVLAAGLCTSGVQPVTTATGTSLLVYPNPSNGSFTLNIQSDVTEEAHVIICGISGEKVKEFNTVTNSAVDMRMPHIAGMYFISVTTAQGSYATRMLIQ